MRECCILTGCGTRLTAWLRKNKKRKATETVVRPTTLNCFYGYRTVEGLHLWYNLMVVIYDGRVFS